MWWPNILLWNLSMFFLVSSIVDSLVYEMVYIVTWHSSTIQKEADDWLLPPDDGQMTAETLCRGSLCMFLN